MAVQRLNRKARTAMAALSLVLIAAAVTLINRCVQSIVPEPIVAQTASVERLFIEAAKKIITLL